MMALITGATGFIGSAVARELLQAGYALRVLVRPQSDRRNLAGLEVECIEGDLNDIASLRRAVEGCTHLFHAAADYRLWVADAAAMEKTNVEGTRNIVLAAAEAGVKRIVYTSSVATLGHAANGSSADEETPARLNDMIGPYKRSKYLAEAEVRRLVDEQGLPAVVVNPSAPVGPRDIKPTPTGRLILDAARGRMPAYVDTGLNIVHVDDVAVGHRLAAEHGVIGERYILGGENMSLKAILAAIAAVTGRPPPRLRLPHRLVLPLAFVVEALARINGASQPLLTVDGVRMARNYMFYSSAKAERVLGYRSRPAQAAIADAVAWFREHGYCP